jgi:superfamily II DNA or RNA helicase
MRTYRKHQATLAELMEKTFRNDLPTRILSWVVPGGGKSMLPGIIAQRFPTHKIGWFVPRLSLAKQAAQSLFENFEILVRESGNDVNPRRGTRGFVTTHQGLMENTALWEHELRREPYIVVIDESHHVKETRKGEMRRLAQSVSRLRDVKSDIWLDMTGTLELNDPGMLIHGLDYLGTGSGYKVSPETSCDHFIRYDRQTALDEGAIVPIEFYHHDGPVRWIDAVGKEQEARLSLQDEHDTDKIFVALQTEIADQLFDQCITHWKRHGRKLLIVADSQKSARLYHKRLASVGITAALAITDNDEAHEQVKRFRSSNSLDAIVTCQMAYEGLDKPEITHILCLTLIRSIPWIEQMFGRAWRAMKGKRQCWAFVPDDYQMRYIIDKIREETPSLVGYGNKTTGGTGGEGGRLPILALSSLTDLVRHGALDTLAGNEDVNKMLEILARYGINLSDPDLQKVIDKITRPPIPDAPFYSEQEKQQRMRNQIADRCRAMDASRMKEFGTTQSQLMMKTGKSITEMDTEELENAWRQLAFLHAG